MRPSLQFHDYTIRTHTHTHRMPLISWLCLFDHLTSKVYICVCVVSCDVNHFCGGGRHCDGVAYVEADYLPYFRFISCLSAVRLDLFQSVCFKVASQVAVIKWRVRHLWTFRLAAFSYELESVDGTHGWTDRLGAMYNAAVSLRTA